MESQAAFRPGATVTLDRLNSDPYPIYAALRASEPVSWIDDLQMWYVTRHDDVQAVLRDPERFTTRFDESTIFDTFGVHMLTSDGKEQQRFRDEFRGAFAPDVVRHSMECVVRERAALLVESLIPHRQAEMRSQFAARLPVLTMLALFGLPDRDEQCLRHWYDSFEQGLANFRRDPMIRSAARASADAFHDLLQRRIDEADARPGSDLLSDVVNREPSHRLSDEEIKRNASIIFFGGISTVEGLILNSLGALFGHQEILERVLKDFSLIPAVIEETMRWMSPVQSATRHTTADVILRGISIPAGSTVNCMLGAANRDPSVFANPDRFDINRPDIRRHLGFGAGPHFCLGSHLAKIEAQVALETLLNKLPGLELMPGEPVVFEGYEFRQPRRLFLRWAA